VTGEFIEREWFVVGDLRHADVPEALPGGPLDVLKQGQFVLAHRTDRHERIVRGVGESATE
jgi:hypothetical protein